MKKIIKKVFKYTFTGTMILMFGLSASTLDSESIVLPLIGTIVSMIGLLFAGIYLIDTSNVKEVEVDKL